MYMNINKQYTTPCYLGYNSVLVGNPLWELLHVVLHPVVLGVEDVHAVQRGSDPVFVNVVVAVAPDVVPLVQHQNPAHQKKCMQKIT